MYAVCGQDNPVTTDPLEGVDASGHITTGVDRTRIVAPFDGVLADCAETLRRVLGSGLHGLYVYGSVATGQATPRRSDLDLYAVVSDDAAASRCTRLGTELSDRHRDIVRDVGIARISLEQLFSDGDTGQADRCFLKHYCVNIAGTDLRSELPACRPTPTIAREFIGDLAGTFEMFRHRLAGGADVAGNVARKLLRSAAVHFSVEDGGWSTAGRVGADLIAMRNPRYAATAEAVLPWSQPSSEIPTATPAEVRAVLDGLGSWLVAQISTSNQLRNNTDPEQPT
jgi:predicted nucleotidyltransferase